MYGLLIKIPLILLGIMISFKLYAHTFVRMNAPSVEYYVALIGFIIFTATLSGLAFSAYSCNDIIEKKKLLRQGGERLFSSSLLFILALGSQYDALGLPENRELTISTTRNVFQLIMPLSGMILFICATMLAMSGIFLLSKAMYVYRESKLDKSNKA